MRLSIVVPVLNEAAGIQEALLALEPLRSRGHEVIIADGGSTDTTVALAQPFADRVIASPRGRALQMNAGANASTGEAVLFLHADTRLPRDADRIIATALSQRCWGRFDVRIDSPHPVLRVVSAMMNLRSRVTGVATGDQSIFVSRRVFEAAGGFPPIPLMEDVALSARLKQFGAPACLAAKVVTSARRWEQHGVLSTIFLMWRLRLMFHFGADPDSLARLYARNS